MPPAQIRREHATRADQHRQDVEDKEDEEFKFGHRAGFPGHIAPSRAERRRRPLTRRGCRLAEDGHDWHLRHADRES
jgi:hypothetical protein